MDNDRRRAYEEYMESALRSVRVRAYILCNPSAKTFKGHELKLVVLLSASAYYAFLKQLFTRSRILLKRTIVTDLAMSATIQRKN